MFGRGNLNRERQGLEKRLYRRRPTADDGGAFILSAVTPPSSLMRPEDNDQKIKKLDN